MTVALRAGRFAWLSPLVAGCSVYVGVLAGRSESPTWVVACLTSTLASLIVTRRLLILLALPSLAVGLLSAPGHPVPEPWTTPAGGLEVQLTSDPLVGSYGSVAFGRLESGREIQLRFNADPGLQLGDQIRVLGSVETTARRVRGRTVVGTVNVREIVWSAPSEDPLLRSANALRNRLLGNLDVRGDQGRALLAGFLIGDISSVDRLVVEDLRRSGLSHLVAVSGSNVALFLVLWWIVTSPLALSPRLRGLVGAVGLVLFGHLTRWEPSVIRASAMAGLVLLGRSVGIVIDGWSALSAAVVGTLWLAPHLVESVGFQLSVAATVGILAARPANSSGAVQAATMTGYAQLAVTPILLGHFGTVPLFSPIANLIAIPVVGVATTVGGLGALIGVPPMVELASVGADLVIAVGRVASHWPQIGWRGTALLVVGLVVARWKPAVRPWLGLVLAIVLVLSVVPGLGRTVERPSVVFLDVGQGDSALVLGRAFTVLIDGGPDPALLDRKLGGFGIDHIDLLVVTHVHADHVEGLQAVIGRRSVGRVWEAMAPHTSPAAERFMTSVASASLRIERPSVGTVLSVGEISIEVLGPRRRYASPNDQSMVILIEVDGFRFLFPGDVETFAQDELTVSDVNVLKVPHQGAATSLPGWLVSHAGSVSVISVGPNDFGHPSDDVVSVLSAAGALVCRTDLDGDVVIRPGRTPDCGR